MPRLPAAAAVDALLRHHRGQRDRVRRPRRAAAERGLGLLGIRERASLLRGDLRLESVTRHRHAADRRTAGGDARTDCRRHRRDRASVAGRRRRPSLAKLRILLGDDHTLLRLGLRKILEERPDWEVIAEAGDGRDAVRQTLTLSPDVAVLDIGMPLLNGIEATRQIVRRLPTVGVLILSMHADEAYITQALQAGREGLPAQGLGRTPS